MHTSDTTVGMNQFVGAISEDEEVCLSSWTRGFCV